MICFKMFHVQQFLNQNSHATAATTEGLFGQYQFKYQHKSTNQDDTIQCKKIDHSIKEMIGRVHDDDKKGATRKIARAAFSHSKTNVMSPCFASYLTHHDSCFHFSHKTVHCPSLDMIKLLNSKQVGGCSVCHNKKGDVFLESWALYCSCRPQEMEHVSLKDFFEPHEVRHISNNAKKNNK